MSELRLTPRLLASAFVLLLIAGTLFALFGTKPELALSRTSHGEIPEAFGASFEVLTSLGQSPARSRKRLTVLPPQRALWVVAPEWSSRELAAQAKALARLAKQGGTVVVMGAPNALVEQLGLTTPPAACAEPAGTADDAPKDEAAKQEPPKPEDDEPGEPEDGEAEAEEAANAKKPRRVAGQRPQRVAQGALLPRPRSLLAQASFAGSPASEAAVQVQLGDAPFVIERPEGKGRLVAVADADWLRNAELDEADHALLLVDLVRAYGAPIFDERCHGLLATPSLWSALGGGFCALIVTVALLLVVVLVGHARRWPAPAVEAAAPAPTLELFVASLASLYEARGRREAAAVFAAYRTGFVHRLRRSLFGQLATGEQRIEQQLAHDAAALGEHGAFLRGAAPHSESQLLEAARTLERYAAQRATRKGRT